MAQKKEKDIELGEVDDENIGYSSENVSSIGDESYQWEIQKGWESMTDSENNLMERHYCNTNKEPCVDVDINNKCFKVSFDDMSMYTEDRSVFNKIRRLKHKGESDISNSYQEFDWYWEDDYEKWIKYSEMNTKQTARSDKDSSYFEPMYDAYTNGIGSSTASFKAGNHEYTLDFATMTQTNDHYCTNRKVRRVTSNCDVNDDVNIDIEDPACFKSESEESDISEADEMCHSKWYWQDRRGNWIEYAKLNTTKRCQSDNGSSDLERFYQKYKSGNGDSTVSFRAGNQYYTLNFDTMTQINDSYYNRIRNRIVGVTTRNIRRIHSRYITLDEVNLPNDTKIDHCIPGTWDTSDRTQPYRLVRVPMHDENVEYKKIEQLFKKTLPDKKIRALHRVQNEFCWIEFTRHKEMLMRKTSRKDIEEQQLFHGTDPKCVDDICRDNFDFRLSGQSTGFIYGKGTYFATTSKYSDGYAKADVSNKQKMFVARVLVGDYTTGTSNMCRPPFKDSSNKSLGKYDTCVDDESDPSMFVVFDNCQMYPQYLITYSKHEPPRSYQQQQPPSLSDMCICM